MLLKFKDKTALYELRPRKRLPVVPYILGIVREELKEIGVPVGTTNVVQARKMNDSPKIAPKGDTIVVSDSWYLYMRKLMTQKAWEWWGVTPRFLMINRDSKWSNPDIIEMPKFECIALPLNFIAAYNFVNGFARVVARNSQNFNTNTLDPKVDNWFYRPWQFSKASVHNAATGGNIGLVGDGLHVYTPIIKEEPDIYIQRDFVEWFPPLPMSVTYQGKQYTITGYCLLGASVYGHADEMDIPLRLARVPGELIHPCPEWMLKEKPVPVEVRAEWSPLVESGGIPYGLLVPR